MARKRDYAAEYARRQAKARSLGYRSYYSRRTRGAKGQRLRELRGHASAADFARTLRSGRVSLITQEPVGKRDPKTGQFPGVRVTAQLSDGTQRRFTLRGPQLRRAPIERLRGQLRDAGIDIYDNPSVDILGWARSEPEEMAA